MYIITIGGYEMIKNKIDEFNKAGIELTKKIIESIKKTIQECDGNYEKGRKLWNKRVLESDSKLNKHCNLKLAELLENEIKQLRHMAYSLKKHCSMEDKNVLKIYNEITEEIHKCKIKLHEVLSV